MRKQKMTSYAIVSGNFFLQHKSTSNQVTSEIQCPKNCVRTLERIVTIKTAKTFSFFFFFWRSGWSKAIDFITLIWKIDEKAASTS